MSRYRNFSVPKTRYSGFQSFNQINFNNFLHSNQRERHQATFVCLQHMIVCGTFPRLPTHINQQASACWHQATFSSDAVTATSFYDATSVVFSQIREPHAVRVRLDSLHVAPSHSGSLRSNVICLACLSTLNQQCRQPKQQIRKLTYRLYTLAC